MAVAATMSYTATPSAPLGVFVPSTPLVVKREKRRRRRQAGDAAEKQQPSAKRRAVRNGFVFDDAVTDTDRSVIASASSTTTNTASAFVFRVRKSHTKSQKDVDAKSATDALLKKKQRELKRERLQKKKDAMEREEKFEAALADEHKLSEEQLRLYYAVRDQVKRETRKAKRDFARSAARGDILQLTETSLYAIKSGIVEFMTANPPSQEMVNVPNPENERLQAMIESYEARIKELEKEEAEWTSIKESISSAPNKAPEGSTEESEAPATQEVEEVKEEVTCELLVTREIEEKQRAVIAHVEKSAKRLEAVQDSIKSVDRLILQAEMKKSKLFDAFHGSAFKGYVNMADPKETLRSLLKLAPPSSPQ